MTTAKVSDVYATSNCIDSTTKWYNTSDSCCTISNSCACETPKKEAAPNGASNLLVSENGKLQVKNCKDGFVENTISIMPAIKEIIVKENGDNYTVVFVTFTDGKTEKAILDKEDEFSLEHGLTIIMLEKLLSDKGVNGKSIHNKLVKYAMKFYDRQEKKKRKEAQQKAEEKARINNIKERNRKKQLKKAQAEREYQIEIQTEAYIRAMKAMAKESE